MTVKIKEAIEASAERVLRKRPCVFVIDDLDSLTPSVADEQVPTDSH
jgi:hypothetical protein